MGWLSKTTHRRRDRNAMHEFIAKHRDKITGTLAGFDRLVFRGTLRSIAHDQGMKRYLWANQVLLKDFGSHVERVSRRLKEASLAEAEALGRPVKYLTSKPSEQGGNGPRHRGQGRDWRRTGVRAELCGAVLELRDSPQPRDQETGTGAALPQVPLLVPLLDAPGVGLHERPHSNLVSLSDSDLPERPRVVGAADGGSGGGVRAAG